MPTPLEIALKRQNDELLRIIKCQQAECTCTPPSITTQPQNRVVVDSLGGSVTLTVIATGEGLVYQWKLNGTDIVTGIEASLTIDPITENDLGTYTVVVTNSCGSITSTSSIISVAVAPIIVFGAWLPIDTDAWTILQTNDPFTYQWTKVINHNDDVGVDFRAGSFAGNMEFVFKIPKGESIKLSWFNTPFNYGPLDSPGDQAWHSAFPADYNDYNYYISRGDIGLDPSMLTYFRSAS